MPRKKRTTAKKAKKAAKQPMLRPVTEEQKLDYRSHMSWRIFRIMAEFTDGFEFINRLEKPVTIFGSARTPASSKHYKDARVLAKKLGTAGYTVVTGGGPGIMEAANRGAKESGAPSVGLNIQLPYEQRMNKYVTHGIGFNYFFSRKTMLGTSSQAYVFFPGGFGTLDEFFTIATLIQTGKIDHRPLILFGKEYWNAFDDFIRMRMLKIEKAIDRKDASMYTVCDSVEHAVRIIKRSSPREFVFM